jgi:hypothetical protein
MKSEIYMVDSILESYPMKRKANDVKDQDQYDRYSLLDLETLNK